jgi:hypothetical protein
MMVMSECYFVARGPFGGRAKQEGDAFLLRIMSEQPDRDGQCYGWGVRMTAQTVAGPFAKDRAEEVLSSILMACPEYRTDQDEASLPKWIMTPEDIEMTRKNMGLPSVEVKS